MRLGLSTPIVQQVPERSQPWERGAGPEELVRVARAADRLGFAWLSCSDHVAVPQSYVAAMGPLWYEPVATLAFLAAHTTRIALLSHVLVLPYRHPLLIAKAFATLDRLSSGRVILGTGVGHLKPEFRSLGLDFAERGRHADETLEAIRRALEDESSSFSGEFAAWRDMVVAPRAVQRPRPPIWVGGNGRAAIRRVVWLADGWIPWQLELAQFRDLVGLLRDLAARDRPGEELVVVAPASLLVSETPESFVERAETWIAGGATAFHVAIEHRSLTHLLERMEALAAAAGTSP
jgi:probable F420-dependent oxidoreductase